LFNIINFSQFSALEQFEILTLKGPELGFISNILSFFIPKSFWNNFSFSMLIILFYLYALCDLKKFNPNYLYNINNNDTNNNKLEIKLEENNNNIKQVNPIILFNYYDLTIESVFLINSFTNFVQNQILENMNYFKSIFLNYTLALFIFLLSCNLFGMIPYSLTISSYLILTLNLSGMSFFGNLIIALKIHKLKFFKFFIPSGVNGLLVVLMVLIELISYIARLFSMAIRLFANMLSGHALIKILSGLVFLSFSDIYFFGIINILFNLVLLAVTALEVIVAALQSYVFVVLSVVYTNEAIVLH